MMVPVAMLVIMGVVMSVLMLMVMLAGFLVIVSSILAQAVNEIIDSRMKGAERGGV